MGARKTTPQSHPTIRDLTRAEIDALLKRNNVGRLAFVIRNAVTIEPIHYVYHANWLHCRTSPGMKLEAIRHSPWVAFEADEIDGLFEWRSVVIRGTAYEFSEDGTAAEKAAFRRAVKALRELVPDALREDDPVPFRQLIFGIYVHEATGRKASNGGRGKRAKAAKRTR